MDVGRLRGVRKYVVATYKLQYAARWDTGVIPTWTVVDTQTETRGMADFDKAGLAPKNPAPGYYRGQVTMAWYGALHRACNVELIGIRVG